ncbi:hypothetical protein HDV05_008000 [Chytridiales sp. JEL 0842]|nr:hypothetical protein HDV05_008000 [Chytridiales sp. JEL 0842]
MTMNMTMSLMRTTRITTAAKATTSMATTTSGYTLLRRSCSTAMRMPRIHTPHTHVVVPITSTCTAARKYSSHSNNFNPLASPMIKPLINALQKDPSLRTDLENISKILAAKGYSFNSTPPSKLAFALLDSEVRTALTALVKKLEAAGVIKEWERMQKENGGPGQAGGAAGGGIDMIMALLGGTKK